MLAALPRPARAAPWLLLLQLVAGCASEPVGEPAPDFSGERIGIEVHADGFVLFAGERVPLEECLLRLRQRLRPLAPAERKQYWVQVRLPRQDDPVRERAMQRAFDRLLEELRHLGGQVEVTA